MLVQRRTAPDVLFKSAVLAVWLRLTISPTPWPVRSTLHVLHSQIFRIFFRVPSILPSPPPGWHPVLISSQMWTSALRFMTSDLRRRPFYSLVMVTGDASVTDHPTNRTGAVVDAHFESCITDLFTSFSGLPWQKCSRIEHRMLEFRAGILRVEHSIIWC